MEAEAGEILNQAYWLKTRLKRTWRMPSDGDSHRWAALIYQHCAAAPCDRRRISSDDYFGYERSIGSSEAGSRARGHALVGGAAFFVVVHNRYRQAEILYGIELLPKGKRHAALQAAADGMFAEEFAGRILPFDTAAAQAYPHIRAARRSTGRPLADADAQIAAIARCHRAAIATRNDTDFEGCGITVINPWTT